MDRYSASQAHLVVLSAGCLAMTALASSTDDEAVWLLGAALALVPVILVAARDRGVADYLCRWPAGSRLFLALVGVAVASGVLDLGPAVLVGLLSTTVLIYLLVVLFHVWRPTRRDRR